MNKYEDLAIGVSRMWNVKAKTISIIIGARGKNITNPSKKALVIIKTAWHYKNI